MKRTLADLHTYAYSSGSDASEIASELTEDDIEWLRSWCKSLGLPAVLSWVRTNSESIFEFVSLTPARRKAKKWTASREIALPIRYGAVLFGNASQALLSGLNDLPLEGGVPYREMTAASGALLCLLVYDYFDLLWVFGGENPFR